MIYLDAFLPEDGKSVQDYVPAAPLAVIAQAHGDGWRLEHTWMNTTEALFSVTDPADLAWVNALTGAQPLRTLTQPASLPTNAASHLPRTFIQATRDPWFVEAAERAQRTGVQYREIFAAGHDAMVTQPTELAAMLLQLV